MAETYTLNVAGLTRELTICKVNDHMDIAADKEQSRKCMDEAIEGFETSDMNKNRIEFFRCYSRNSLCK